MITTEPLELGPFVVGEIPEPFTYRFLDQVGTAIDFGADTTAAFVYTIDRDEPVVQRNATWDEATKTVTCALTAADTATPGIMRGTVWIDNGTLRFASLDIVAWIKSRPGLTII